MSIQKTGKKTSIMLAIREAIQEEMRRDSSVFIMGEDVAQHGGGFGLTKGLWDEFGDDRVRNTPISENAFVGAALGAAMTGSRPIIEFMFMDFTMVGMDQICNQIAKISYMTGGQTSAPLVLRCPQGGLSWKSAAAQHAQSLEAWFVHTPGLIVVFPSTPYDAKGLMKSAIRSNSPVVFIEHKAIYSLEDEIPEEEYLVEIGKADIKRAGKDVTIVASGYMVHFALEAAEKLAELGIDAEVIDPRTLKPLDEETIFSSVRKTNRVVLVHEAPKTCGVAAEWGMRIQEACFDDLDAPIERVSGADVPVPYANSLEKKVFPSVEDIINAARRVCYFPES